MAVLLAGCSGGVEISYDFVEHLSRAEVPGRAALEKEPEPAGDGFFQPAGTEVAFPVYLPEDAQLQFRTVRGEDHPDVELHASVSLRRQDGRSVKAHSRSYGANADAPHVVDLAEYGGSLVNVVFRVRADVERPGLGIVWTEPRVSGVAGEAFEANVLLLVVDTLRADYVGCYGGSPITPNMDALAARGVTFENAYSHVPTTGPAHASIFTSLLPSQHGVLANAYILNSRHNTLAEMMSATYRRTAGFVSLGTMRGQFGMSQGFDVYRDHLHLVGWKTADKVNEEVFASLPDLEDESFFLMVHYSDPHEPYASPDGVFPAAGITLNGEPSGHFPVNGAPLSIPLMLRPGENTLRLSAPGGFTLRGISVSADARLEFGEEWTTRGSEDRVLEATTLEGGQIRVVSTRTSAEEHDLRFFSFERIEPELVKRRYAEEVEYVDRQIGQLLEELDRRGQLDNTLIVFTSDHGEGLGDHNHIGHSSQVYNSLTRVPLILSYPGHLPEGKRIEAPAAHIDIYPTILDLLDLETSQRMEGISLLDSIDGGAHDPHRRIILEAHQPEAPANLRSVVEGGYKYIRNDSQFSEELYNVEDDPGELNNLLPDSESVAAGLRESLETEYGRLRSEDPLSPQERELSEKELDRLRSLGYVR